MPRSRAKPEDLKLPRGRPPLKGTKEYKEYMKIKEQISALRDAKQTANGLPRVRRGAPPRDPDARMAWQAQNELAREIRQQTGAKLVQGKSPHVYQVGPVVEEAKESDDDILKRHKEADETLRDLVHSVALGDLRSLIVAGGPGLGKTVTSSEILNYHRTKNGLRYRTLKGKVSAVRLFTTAYSYRHPNDRLLVDDADSLLFGEDSLNLMKALTDSTEKREPTWNTNAILLDDQNKDVPRNGWEYEGGIIINSNLDFDRIISGPPSRISDHLRAVVNRVFLFNMRMYTPRETFIWTKYKCESLGILTGKPHYLTPKQQSMALNWMDENKDNMREVSIRSALQVAFLISKHTKKWEAMARNSLFGQRKGLYDV